MSGLFKLHLLISLAILHQACAELLAPPSQSECEHCASLIQTSTAFSSCYFHNCKSQSISLFSTSECHSCKGLTADEQLNCALSYCRSQIHSQLSSLYPDTKPQSLKAYLDNCYSEFLLSGLDYGICAYRYCVDPSMCHFCDELSNSEDERDCRRRYCPYYFPCKKSDLNQEESANNAENLDVQALVTLECLNCRDILYRPARRSCMRKYCSTFTEIQKDLKIDESFIIHNTYMHLSKSGTNLVKKIDLCRGCSQFEDSLKRSYCIVANCKEELFNKKLYLDKTEAFSDNCINLCISDEEADQKNCLSQNCRAKIEKVFSLYLAKQKLMDEVQHLDCASCLSSEFLSRCVVKSCEQISSKSSLFSDNTIEFSDKCKVCLTYSGAEYDYCVFHNCKIELTKKTFLVAAYEVEKIKTIRNFDYGTHECFKVPCSQVVCPESKCESFSQVKNNLLSNPSSNCKECGQFSDKFFANCASVFCKEEIEQLSSTQSKGFLPKTDLNTCTDSCYYDWYYYGYDFKTCAYDYCNAFLNDIKVPAALSEEPQTKHCRHFCQGNMDSSCLANMCPTPELELLSYSSSHSNCKSCYSSFKSNGYTNNGFRLCVALHCEEELNQKSALALSVNAEVDRTWVEDKCKETLGQENFDFRQCYTLIDSIYSQGWSLGSISLGLIAVFGLLACLIKGVNKDEKSYRLLN